MTHSKLTQLKALRDAIFGGLIPGFNVHSATARVLLRAGLVKRNTDKAYANYVLTEKGREIAEDAHGAFKVMRLCREIIKTTKGEL
jgi:hypothetical protein